LKLALDLWSPYFLGCVEFYGDTLKDLKAVEKFVKDVVKIRKRELRIQISDLFFKALADMSDEDRVLVMTHLRRVISRSAEPEESPAFVEKLDDGFVLVIRPEAFTDYGEKLAIIRHELDEIIRMVRYGESIHGLMFIFLSGLPEDEECAVCGGKITEGYCIDSDEGTYLEELASVLKEDFVDLTICNKCMIEGCSNCEKFEICHFETPLEVCCRHPEQWIKRTISRRKKLPTDSQ
jgi:hypothetical protein